MLNVFVSRDDLKAAVAAWIDGKAAAEAKHGSISSWDVSRVNDFSELFCGFSWCEGGEGTYNPASMFNGDVGSWDTSKVMTMYRTFGGAKAFNSELVWDTSKVTAMEETFHHAEAFNQPLVWDTSQVTTLEDTDVGGHVRPRQGLQPAARLGHEAASFGSLTVTLLVSQALMSMKS